MKLVSNLGRHSRSDRTMHRDHHGPAPLALKEMKFFSWLKMDEFESRFEYYGWLEAQTHRGYEDASHARAQPTIC